MKNPDHVKKDIQRHRVENFLIAARFSDCTMYEIYQFFRKNELYSSRIQYNRFRRFCRDFMKKDSRFTIDLHGNLYSKKWVREKGIVLPR